MSKLKDLKIGETQEVTANEKYAAKNNYIIEMAVNSEHLSKGQLERMFNKFLRSKEGEDKGLKLWSFEVKQVKPDSAKFKKYSEDR